MKRDTALKPYQRWRAKQIAAGRCVMCGSNKARKGLRTCQPCSDKAQSRMTPEKNLKAVQAFYARQGGQKAYKEKRKRAAITSEKRRGQVSFKKWERTSLKMLERDQDIYAHILSAYAEIDRLKAELEKDWDAKAKEEKEVADTLADSLEWALKLLKTPSLYMGKPETLDTFERALKQHAERRHSQEQLSNARLTIPALKSPVAQQEGRPKRYSILPQKENDHRPHGGVLDPEGPWVLASACEAYVGEIHWKYQRDNSELVSQVAALEARIKASEQAPGAVNAYERLKDIGEIIYRQGDEEETDKERFFRVSPVYMNRLGDALHAIDKLKRTPTPETGAGDEAKAWDGPCNQCGGNGGHEEGCTGHKATASEAFDILAASVESMCANLENHLEYEITEGDMECRGDEDCEHCALLSDVYHSRKCLTEYREALRTTPTATLSALAPVVDGGWRSIETAPKDGTTVWIFSFDKCQYQAHFEDGLWWWKDIALYGEGGPTHWQPLPPAPKSKGGGV